MARNYGTDSRGGSFSDETRLAVWNKAAVVPGVDPGFKRKDACGAWIQLNQYGVTVHHGMGWEIDHINPVANGGSDNISNLQPLQWENNRAKSDSSSLSCAVSSYT